MDDSILWPEFQALCNSNIMRSNKGCVHSRTYIYVKNGRCIVFIVYAWNTPDSRREIARMEVSRWTNRCLQEPACSLEPVPYRELPVISFLNMKAKGLAFQTRLSISALHRVLTLLIDVYWQSWANATLTTRSLCAWPALWCLERLEKYICASCVEDGGTVRKSCCFEYCQRNSRTDFY